MAKLCVVVLYLLAFLSEVEATQREDTIPPEVASLSVTSDEDSVRVSWSPPSDSDIMVRGYMLDYGKDILQYEVDIDANTHEYTILELDPDTQYTISIRSYNFVGMSRSIYKTIRTLARTSTGSSSSESEVPHQPAALTVSPGVNSMTVTWLPPPGNIVVQGYHLQCRQGGGQHPPLTVRLLANVRTYTFRNLEPNTEYIIRVNAFSTVGTGQSVSMTGTTVPRCG